VHDGYSRKGEGDPTGYHPHLRRKTGCDDCCPARPVRRGSASTSENPVFNWVSPEGGGE